jgi:hypothetical protein
MMDVNLEGAALVRDSISYSWRCILKIIELLKLCVIKRVGVGQAAKSWQSPADYSRRERSAYFCLGFD